MRIDSGASDLLLEHFGGNLEYHDPWHLGREVSHLFRGNVDAMEADALLTGFTPELLLVLYRRETIPAVGATVAGDGELVTAFLEHAVLA